MKRQKQDLAASALNHSRRTISKIYLPRLVRCLQILSEEEIWWRPNPASNSAGNLILHLEGNVRQWIISGLGGKPDKRDRDREFEERGPISRRALMMRLRNTVAEADRVLGRLHAPDLLRQFSIQGFQVTGLEAIGHVAEHFSFHAGQIIYITKLKHGEDLAFTRLPAQRRTAAQKAYPAF